MTRLTISKGLLSAVVGMGIIGAVLTIWLQSRHARKSERAGVRVINFMPNNTDKYLKCDAGFLPDAGAMSQSGYNVPVTPYDGPDRFSVIMMVFDRLKSYREVIQHYICMPFVDRFLLLWSNPKVGPPTRESLNISCSEKLFVRRKPNIVRGRFVYFPEIQTDAVFSLDDDNLLPASDLQHAFNVWKKYPWGIVGYVARGCVGTAPNVIYEAPTPWSYRLILTGAAFLHREYLRLFDEKCPAEVKAYLDRINNCDDIMMNFIIKDHCRCSGVFYAGHGHFSSPKYIEHGSHLSRRRTHYGDRTGCLRKLLNLYSKTFNFTESKCIYS